MRAILRIVNLFAANYAENNYFNLLKIWDVFIQKIHRQAQVIDLSLPSILRLAS